MLFARSTRLFCLAILPCLAVSAGCGQKTVRVSDPTGIGPYVEKAKIPEAASQRAEGSLWAGQSSRNDLFRDFKARSINDVVTIRVVESTTADVAAGAANSKSSDTTAGFDKLFGLEKKVNEIPTMVSGKSSGSFQGKGSTSRATTLLTSLTARVTDVLPNGYLVIEGLRQVRVNNEDQTVSLTGIVRPEDVSRNNVVLSSAVAQMSVTVHGKGIVSQPLKPGWLYRILSGVLPF